MINQDLVIIKLGGSVITNKEIPLSLNSSVVEKIIKEIKKLRKRYKIILVHGGGSFGHYWSVKFDMHTKPLPYPDDGVSRVHESMIKLNYLLIDILMSYKMKPYTIPPSSFVFNNLPCPEHIRDILSLTTNNELIPITYGDVIHTNNGNFSILSGDRIMSLLAVELKPRISIFTTNVDGLYENLEKKNVIKEVLLNDGDLPIRFNDKSVEFPNKGFDVTGGMKRKVSESITIAKSGIPVYLVNGLYPERIGDVVEDRNYVGTSIKLSKNITK